MDWGRALWDQYDVLDKHTLSGLELLERYVKFVKERTDIEQNYAKQLRSLSRKYSRRGSKEEPEIKFTNQQAFQEVVNELNVYANHREQLADSLSINICVELTKCLHELKMERKTYLTDIKKAQQNLEMSFRHLEACKKRFEREWKEAEKVSLQADKIEQDTSSTKADVDKARVSAHHRIHTADECKNEYAAQLQKYNKEQNSYYHTEIPTIFNKLQDLDGRRIKKLAEGYSLLADTERNMLPTLGKSLDTINAASNKANEKQDSMTLIEQHKSGLAPPTDVEFEDYSQGIKPASVENSVHGAPKVRIKHLFKKNKSTAPEKIMPPPVEDYSHLPIDQRKKRLKNKIDDITKELQKEVDQSDALNKMKNVYENNSQLGDPTSLEPQINQTTHIISRLKGDLDRYKAWLNEIEDASLVNKNQTSASYISVEPMGPTLPEPDDLYECNFYEDFDEDPVTVPISQCQALYSFDGRREGEVSMQMGEQLSVLDEDHGDGWVRVQKSTGDDGYVPASYIKII